MATTFEQSGSTLIVKPEGRIDTKTSPILEKDIRAHFDSAEDIIIDFENVEYISSGGMRIMLALKKQLSAKNGTLKIINVKEAIYEIFNLVGFANMVEVKND